MGTKESDVGAPLVQNKCNVGYAFINMVSSSHIISFYEVFLFPPFPSAPELIYMYIYLCFFNIRHE